MTQSAVLSLAAFEARVSGMAMKHDDRVLAAEALRRLRRRPRRFTLPGGHTVEIPKAAGDGLIEMLEAVAAGDTATVVRLIDEGALPARKVGSHRRIPLADLLAYRDQMVAQRRQALEDMVRDAETLGLYT